MKNTLPADFKKVASVTRERKYFFYSSTLAVWALQNPLSGDWFIDTEKTRLPYVFKTSLAAMKFASDTFKPGETYNVQ